MKSLICHIWSNVDVSFKGWDFPPAYHHMDGILEGNTRLAVRPAECELAQDGVYYRGDVVGLGKRSPAQLKLENFRVISSYYYNEEMRDAYDY
ncbi:hypothetical protein TNIN_13611 [Trichonephila inaurata madagascariensis]|uniref:Uncharacterized protein n=1 Tax=Trichonephila inaurata madagascariensis TaxID=2747483 RepID=A0A8X6IX23_9ARAC|nr:hypothetical protein TNIN_13611 [Trichonephila inaurata madagascariensis]